MVLPMTKHLLIEALKNLDDAAGGVNAPGPNRIFVYSHLAACNAAAALISARITPQQAGKMRRPRSIWEALLRAEPDMAEWAHYFASRAVQRDKAEHELPNVVRADQAEMMLADATTFISLVEEALGLKPKELSCG